jgi:hypothetical protein
MAKLLWTDGEKESSFITKEARPGYFRDREHLRLYKTQKKRRLRQSKFETLMTWTLSESLLQFFGGNQQLEYQV